MNERLNNSCLRVKKYEDSECVRVCVREREDREKENVRKKERESKSV